MYLKPKLKCSDGVFNLFINNKEIKTPEKVPFNFKDKIFPNLILKEIKKLKLKNLNQSTYYNIFSLAKDKIQVDKQKYIEEVLKYINTDSKKEQKTDLRRMPFERKGYETQFKEVEDAISISIRRYGEQQLMPPIEPY